MIGNLNCHNKAERKREEEREREREKERKEKKEKQKEEKTPIRKVHFRKGTLEITSQ